MPSLNRHGINGMQNILNKTQPKFAGLARIKVVWITATLLAALSACSAVEPQQVSLTGIVYNYSEDALVYVRVNGQGVGRASEAKPGGVMGGGGMCCFELPENAKQVEVQVKPAGLDSYTTTATIEKWWPDLAHYGVVHVLPGRKVVIEVRAVGTWPREDLMDAQLKALHIKKVVNYTGPMNTGPMERADGKQ